MRAPEEGPGLDSTPPIRRRASSVSGGKELPPSSLSFLLELVVFTHRVLSHPPRGLRLHPPRGLGPITPRGLRSHPPRGLGSTTPRGLGPSLPGRLSPQVDGGEGGTCCAAAPDPPPWNPTRATGMIKISSIKTIHFRKIFPLSLRRVTRGVWPQLTPL